MIDQLKKIETEVVVKEDGQVPFFNISIRK